MDRVVTLFGGGGFIGRYAAQSVYKTGARVRVAQRNPRSAWFLQPLGGLGQTQIVGADIRNPNQVAEAVRGSFAVVNLVGVFGRDAQAMNVEGARNVAEAAAAAGVASLVHVSAIGADPNSPSSYGRSKGLGEAAVREAFPGATIIRPSVVFGQEDNFLNRFARLARLLPALPVIRGAAKFQPVYVADVGRAIAAAALDPVQHGGETYELAGPQVLSMEEINKFVLGATARKRELIPVPDSVAGLLARYGGWAPGAPMTWDQWLMLQTDNVASGTLPGLEAFGITPTPVAAAAELWMTAYRRQGRFASKSPAKSPY